MIFGIRFSHLCKSFQSPGYFDVDLAIEFFNNIFCYWSFNCVIVNSVLSYITVTLFFSDNAMSFGLLVY